MKKYFVALALVCMTSLVFAGCGAETDQADTTSEVEETEDVVVPEVEETSEEEVEEGAETEEASEEVAEDSAEEAAE